MESVLTQTEVTCLRSHSCSAVKSPPHGAGETAAESGSHWEGLLCWVLEDERSLCPQGHAGGLSSPHPGTVVPNGRPDWARGQSHL